MVRVLKQAANTAPAQPQHLPKRWIVAAVLSLCFFSLHSFSQFITDPEKTEQRDTAAILSLVAKGMDLNSTEPDKALPFFTEALKKSYEAAYSKGIVLSLTKISAWHYGNNINATIDEASEALQVYGKEKMTDLAMKAELHLTLAEAYDEKGKKDSAAFFYYLLGREIENKNITDPTLTINIFTKLTIFWINFNYDINANEEYKQTLRRYVEKAKLASADMKDTNDAKSAVYFLQGAYYHGIKKFDSARYFYLSYYEKREQLHKLSLPRRISILTNITDTYLQEHQPEKALPYIDQVSRLGNIPEQNKFLAFYIAFNELQRAKALYQQQKYAASIALTDNTITKLKATGEHLRDEVVEAYQITADSYEALGDFKNALRYKNIYLSLHDSLNKKEKIDIIHGLEIRFRISEKDKELAEQLLTIAEVKNTVRTRNIWIGSIAVLAFFIAVIFTLWRRKNIHKQKLQQERINNFQKEMEIARLNASITGEERERERMARDLHDGIGGLLAAAKMNFELLKKEDNLTKTQDLNDGIKLLEQASIELRKTAHNMMPDLLLQNGLPQAIRHFCKTIGKNSPTQLKFQLYGTEKRFEKHFELSLYRIVQELVHNMVKHAHATTALVQISFHEAGNVDFTVEDNGTGLPEDAIKNSKGIGLKNVLERTKSLNGKADIYSQPGSGTSINLNFENPPKPTTT
ncbi:MAG: ATP-binding protein [Chitinophagaceae bacterium]